MSDKPVFTTAATMDPAASIASTNKVLSNTYWLLGLTLAFSALTATAAVAINMPQSLALVLMFLPPDWKAPASTYRLEKTGPMYR